MMHRIRIAAGTLSMEIHSAELPLNDLLTFASRENPKRGYLFVSKVLGKHWPCRPSAMRDVYDRLARQVAEVPGPVLTIGLAETATALGHGVHDSLRRLRSDRLAYLHTTRHHLAKPVALTFDEAHSHATDHTVYETEGTAREIFDSAATLVLVDDEVSTGRTLAELARAYIAKQPRVERVVLASIVNWLPNEQRTSLIASIGRPTTFASLLDGTFSFEPDNAYQPAVRPAVAQRPTRWAQTGFGRTGLLSLEAPRLDMPRRPLSLIGTEEFMFAPFLLAERLEQEGHDVLFQSTTRSPIALGDAIRSRLEFEDNYGEGLTHYLYNHAEERHAIVCYEHSDMLDHSLPRLIDASTWAPGC